MHRHANWRSNARSARADRRWPAPAGAPGQPPPRAIGRWTSTLQLPAEERHQLVLKAECDVAGVRAGIDLEAVRDTVAIERLVQLLRVHLQPVLIADIDRD